MKILALTLIAGLAGFGTGCKSKSPAADNTAHNEDPITKTNGDKAAQSGSDLDLTQKIRKALVADDTLSTNAHNAKIVVANGTATLTGPVSDDAEKTKVLQLAQNAGATSVVDHLEVVR